MNPESVTQDHQPVGIVTATHSPANNRRKLYIILGVVAVFILVIIVIVAVVLINFNSTKKLACTSEQGSITLYYDNSGITNYEATNMNYSIDGQKPLVQEKGIHTYIDEFAEWFKNITGETCQKQ